MKYVFLVCTFLSICLLANATPANAMTTLKQFFSFHKKKSKQEQVKKSCHSCSKNIDEPNSEAVILMCGLNFSTSQSQYEQKEGEYEHLFHPGCLDNKGITECPKCKTPLGIGSQCLVSLIQELATNGGVKKSAEMVGINGLLTLLAKKVDATAQARITIYVLASLSLGVMAGTALTSLYFRMKK